LLRSAGVTKWSMVPNDVEGWSILVDLLNWFVVKEEQGTVSGLRFWVLVIWGAEQRPKTWQDWSPDTKHCPLVNLKWLEGARPKLYKCIIVFSGVTRNERAHGKNCVMPPPLTYFFYFKGWLCAASTHLLEFISSLVDCLPKKWKLAYHITILCACVPVCVSPTNNFWTAW
jgi:hypothetical protein